MPALDATELLALMDLNMTAVYAADTRATPGGEVVETSGLFMCRTPHGTVGTNMAIVTGSIDVATVRRLCREMYGADGTPFSVWTREHVDAALARELEADGCLPIHREPGMVLLPEAWERAPVPPDVEVRAVHDAEEYGRVAAAAFGVYGVPDASVTEHFETAASVSGPETQAYLAYRDGRAVAGAILYMAHGVGGIGWVATLPAEFGRGYGRAVTRAVIEDGFARGARFMNLQASPMGEPMYRRMGFTTPTHYRWFLASP